MQVGAENPDWQSTIEKHVARTGDKTALSIELPLDGPADVASSERSA